MPTINQLSLGKVKRNKKNHYILCPALQKCPQKKSGLFEGYDYGA